MAAEQQAELDRDRPPTPPRRPLDEEAVSWSGRTGPLVAAAPSSAGQSKDSLLLESIPVSCVRRFVRVNPRKQLGPTSPDREALLRLELGDPSLSRVRWLESLGAEVYSCSDAVKLSQASVYRSGHLYGIDAASVFAATSLGAKPGERVLDACCAPGGKLSVLADAVLPDGIVYGVDISEQRLAACRTVLLRGAVTNVLLALGDGTNWSRDTCATWVKLAPPPRGRGQRGRQRRSEAAQGLSRGEELESAEEMRKPFLFDRVLVDAECTHSGSLRHLRKFGQQWGWETMERRMRWCHREESLWELQTALLQNGFRLLKPGGTLVYSTCAVGRSQNEDVVAALLAAEPEAELSSLPQQPGPPSAAGDKAAGDGVIPARPSELEAQGPLGIGGHFCTARFDPGTSGVSGLFVARLARRCQG